MAILFRPLDGFVLCFERSDYVVGVIFDRIIINVTTLAALGSRLNINVRHDGHISFIGRSLSSNQNRPGSLI
jgi:hypothetical protein